MPGYLAAMAFTASIPLLLRIFHLVAGHISLMAINAGHAPGFMQAAFPVHSLELDHVFAVIIQAGLGMQRVQTGERMTEPTEDTGVILALMKRSHEH